MIRPPSWTGRPGCPTCRGVGGLVVQQADRYDPALWDVCPDCEDWQALHQGAA